MWENTLTSWQACKQFIIMQPSEQGREQDQENPIFIQVLSQNLLGHRNYSQFLTCLSSEEVGVASVSVSPAPPCGGSERAAISDQQCCYGYPLLTGKAVLEFRSFHDSKILPHSWAAMTPQETCCKSGSGMCPKGPCVKALVPRLVLLGGGRWGLVGGLGYWGALEGDSRTLASSSLSLSLLHHEVNCFVLPHAPSYVSPQAQSNGANWSWVD